MCGKKKLNIFSQGQARVSIHHGQKRWTSHCKNQFFGCCVKFLHEKTLRALIGGQTTIQDLFYVEQFM